MRQDAINIRVTLDFKEELRAAAEEDGRTVSGLVKHLLTNYLKQQKKQGETK